MSLEYTQKITLDLESNSAYTTVSAKSSDQNSRALDIYIQKNGQDYIFQNGSLLQFRLKKPDGTSVIITEDADKYTDEQGIEHPLLHRTSSDPAIIHLIFSGQCLAAAGRGYADIVETLDSSNNNNDDIQIISTVSFILNIMSSPDMSGLISENEFAVILEYVHEAQDAATSAAASASIAIAAIASSTMAFEYATQASQSATMAIQSANIASSSANIAVSAASNALSYMTAASNSAIIATNSAAIALSSVAMIQDYATAAASSAVMASDNAIIALNSANIAKSSATIAIESASIAENSAVVAIDSAEIASSNAEIATSSANIALNSANIALNSANIASDSATIALNSAAISTSSAATAMSKAEDAEAWSVGQRNGMDVDQSDITYRNNAKYWASQAQYASGEKAPINSPSFTGIPTTPNVAVGTSTSQIANTKYVMDSIAALGEVMVFKGIVNQNSDLPTIHSIGWTYKVGTAGTYVGVICEVGDTIVCINNGTSANNNDWYVLQANVDGAVIGPTSSTDGHVVIFDGSSGRLIKDGYGVATSISNSSNTIPTTEAVYAGLNSKQDILTFDTTPTQNSLNPVTSDGIKTAFNKEILYINIASISSLPYTITDSNISSAHVVLEATLGTPNVRTRAWAIITSDGSLTIRGTGEDYSVGIIGETTMTLKLGLTGTYISA